LHGKGRQRLNAHLAPGRSDELIDQMSEGLVREKRSRMPLELFVVLPVYNEEEAISGVLEEWLAVLRSQSESFVLCCLDDGSSDGTAELLDRLERATPEIEVIHKTNSGHGQSCLLGYRRAVELGSQWVFQIDSDGQCDPLDFASFWPGRAKHPVQYGHRVQRDEGPVRRIVSRLLSGLVWSRTGVRVRDANVPFRLMRGDRLAKWIDEIPASFDLVNVLLAVLQQQDEEITWQPIRFRKRRGGRTSLGLFRLTVMGLRLFRDLGPQFSKMVVAASGDRR